MFSKIMTITKKLNMFFSGHITIQNAFLAFITVFITEIFSRNSLLKAVKFLAFSFPSFVMNFLIVFSILCLMQIFKKKKFWIYFACIAWIFISIISFVMFSFRMMPFSFYDILLIPSTFTVIPKYLSIWKMILCVAIIFLLIYAIVKIYIKTKKTHVNFNKSIIICCVAVTVSFLYFFAARYNGILDNRISGLANKYYNNGFVYCYSSSIVDKGMREPSDYSKKQVSSIVKEVADYDNKKPINANVIFVQLESFFDVNDLENITYSENPIPTFTDLEENYSHGFLNVPTFSAGTANTEFEVLTGMNMDFFGVGEFPYQSVAKSKTIETVAYCLKENGYSTHAIHDNSGTFYDRNIIYPNLGFDTFTSIEYMYNIQYNSLGWARDLSLVSDINDALDSSKGRDFIYTVGVQTHGKYETDIPDSAKHISVDGITDEKEKKNFEYYISQIREVDGFIGALAAELEMRDEPTVMVVFGDHMPGFEFEENELKSGNQYQTKYVMWTNFKTDFIIKDLESYQLYSYVLSRMNMTGKIVSKLHQKYAFSPDDKAYLDKLEVIQYDMLYGNGDVYNGKPYLSAKMKMGIKKISIDNVNTVSNNLYVHGKNFNEFSKIFVNGKKYDTVYVDAENIHILEYTPKSGDIIIVSQTDSNGNILSSTNKYVFK